MNLSSNIRYLRKKMGLSQIAFADLIGAKRNTISDYERGRSNPSIELIRKMAALFKLSLDELIEKDMSHYPTKDAKTEKEEGNKLQEEAASYQTRANLKTASNTNSQGYALSPDEPKTEQLLIEIQVLKVQNSAKDKEIFYLQNLLEAKNQSIQNLKKLIAYLEQANKQQ